MLILEDYQARAVDEIIDAIVSGVRDNADAPAACVLVSPTGSGKTLMLTRVLAGLERRGLRAASVWTAPYGNITSQTERAIRNEGGSSIRARALADRTWGGHRTGDVWVTTAQLIASSTAGPAEDSDFKPSLKSLGQAVRDSGRRVGVIIDEAHMNAKDGSRFAAACLALDPDFYIAATATPDDEALSAFFRAVGVRESRLVNVERKEAVSRHLNKRKLDVMFTLTAGAGPDVRSEALISAAWAQRNAVEALWAEIGARETPLMLVQAENGKEGKRLLEAVKRVTGLGDDAVAFYEASSKETRDLTLIAADPKVKALVFKVAAGTGFDAPRACVMASERTVKTRTAAAQYIGRTMRHPQDVRRFLFANPTDPRADVLDTAYLFLTHVTGEQGGFEMAADEMREALSAAGAGEITFYTEGVDGRQTKAIEETGYEEVIARLGEDGPGWDDLEHLNEDLQDFGMRAFFPRRPDAPDRFRREVWTEERAGDADLMLAMTDAVAVSPASVRAELEGARGNANTVLIRDDATTADFEGEQRDHAVDAYHAAGTDAAASLKWVADRLPGLASTGLRRRLIRLITHKVLATGEVSDATEAGRIAVALIRASMGAMKTAALGQGGSVRTEDAAPLPDLIITYGKVFQDRKSVYGHYCPDTNPAPPPAALDFLRRAQSLGIRMGGTCAKVAFADGAWGLNAIEQAFVRLIRSGSHDERVLWWARNPPNKPFSLAMVNAGGDGGAFNPDFVVHINGRTRVIETKYDEKDIREKAARGGVMNADYGEVVFLAPGLNGRIVRKRVVDGNVIEEPFDPATL